MKNPIKPVDHIPPATPVPSHRKGGGEHAGDGKRGADRSAVSAWERSRRRSSGPPKIDSDAQYEIGGIGPDAEFDSLSADLSDMFSDLVNPDDGKVDPNDWPVDLVSKNATAESASPDQSPSSRIDPAALIGALGQQVAAFCGDLSGLGLGDWEIQVMLDEHRFGQTKLYLSFSYARVELRFDAQDAAVKEVLLTHSQSLQRQLSRTLGAWGEACEVAIYIF